MANHPISRLTLGLTFSVLAFLATPARADDLQDATTLYKQGKDAQALEYVDRYLRSRPGDSQARFLKGILLTETGKTQDAIQVFTKLSEDHPELPEPYNNLAVIYASQGQHDKARQALELAIQAKPGYATAYENLGDLYVKMASQAYGKAQQLDPNNTNIQTKQTQARSLLSGSRFIAQPPKVSARKSSRGRH